MCGNYIKRAVSLIFAILMIFSVVSISAFAENNGKSDTYEIAVVYDNSGSMYTSGRTRWSLAKYSMEIFASMIDYSTDRLTIYPMHPVTTDGSTPESGGQTKVAITSRDDIKKIHQMYTPSAGDTPFDQANVAAQDLATSGADNKWLVFVTDGDVTNYNRTDLITPALEKLSTQYNISVQYLGIEVGKTMAPKDNSKDDRFYVAQATDRNIEDKLIEICNKIFERDELKGALKGKKLTLGVSMKKLIVFVQGDGANVTSIKDFNGNSVKILTDSGQISYSDTKYSAGGKYKNATVTDKTLYGRVVTFDACAKGTYDIEYSGSNIQIFYEPDVYIDVVMLDSDGNEVDPEGTLYPGEYSFVYSIRDSVTKEDMTDSELVDVKKFGGYIEITNGDNKKRIDNYKSGAPIKFEEGDEAYLYLEGEYLSGYKITIEDNREGFKFNITDFPDVPEFKAKVDILQDDDWYALKNRDKWKPIKVSFTVGGQPLTDEQMKRVVYDFSMDPELSYDYELLPGESAIAVYIAKDENGNDIPIDIKKNEPDITGSYKFTVTAKYTDENGKVSNEAKDNNSFRIEKFGIGPIKIFILLVILGLLALIYFLTHLPAFPARVRFAQDLGDGDFYPPNGCPIRPSENMGFGIGGLPIFTVNAKKITPWCNRKKGSARISIQVTNFANDIDSMSIDGVPVKVPDGEWITVSNESMVNTTDNKGNALIYIIKIN